MHCRAQSCFQEQRGLLCWAWAGGVRIVNGAARGSISGCWVWEGLQFLVVLLEQDRPWERAGAAAPGSRAEPRLSGWAPPLGFQQVVWKLGRPPLRVGPPQMVPSPPLSLSHWEAVSQIYLLEKQSWFEISSPISFTYFIIKVWCKYSCSFVSHICFIKCVNRTFGAKMRRKWFVLLKKVWEKSQCLWLFFTVFIFFHRVVKLHLYRGELCFFSCFCF